MEKHIQELINAFEIHFDCKVNSVNRLAESGSNRRYYRLIGEKGSAIACIGAQKAENRAFVAIAKNLKNANINVPEVYFFSKNQICYLQQDLGNISLADAVEDGCLSGHYSAAHKTLLNKTIAELAHIQCSGAQNMDWSVCYPQSNFDEKMIAWDLNYFKYCFLKLSGLEIDEVALQADFDMLSTHLLSVPSDCFMFRDFQSRNVMLLDNELYFIDFQGARRGPVHYDLASFVWQAKMHYSAKFKDSLIECYLTALERYRPVDRQAFYAQFLHFSLFRCLQVLGAYGFRGLYEGKEHFLKSISSALDNLLIISKSLGSQFPYIRKLAKSLTKDNRFVYDEEYFDGLTVEVYSFSYKKGLPRDLSGNGGGYVFDCRAINNPGRYSIYAYSSGLDQNVVDFLQQDGSSETFLEPIKLLAESHVSKYLERGFSHLMFSFGCTGGQHRSVYCAHSLAGYLQSKFSNVRVIENHLQQPYWRKKQ